jgi:hypothetical protein
MKKPNTVTLGGRDKEYIESLIPEVEKGVDGKRVMIEGNSLDGDGKKDPDA